jgi:hypothetical protein
VIFNFAATARTLTMQHMHVSAGTLLRDALGAEQPPVSITSVGDVTVTVAPLSVRVLVN